MRIVHIVLPGASEYEKKSQRIDAQVLGRDHEVVLAAALRDVPSADAAQIYGPSPALPLHSIPVIATAVPRRRFGFRRPAVILVSPVKRDGFEYLPEAVEELWFDPAVPPPAAGGGVRRTIGSFLRPSIVPFVEQTVVRLNRTREDIEWLLLDHPPTPAEMDSFAAWVDPAEEEDDFDGFVAEALVAGITGIASRTPINAHRLEKGRTGFLVPLHDANELSHAILAALFKTEVAQQRIEAARQTVSKFRPRQRIRVLAHMLEIL